jgi:two-component system nitrate/nitrite response regulator NarL
MHAQDIELHDGGTMEKIGLANGYAGVVASSVNHVRVARENDAQKGPSGAKTRLLLVHDQLLMRELVRDLLERQPRTSVVGEASEPDEAVLMARETLPDVILIDHQALMQTAASWVPALQTAAPRSPILALTGVSDAYAIKNLIHLGVRGVILKTAPLHQLTRAIEKVCAGELWLDRAVVCDLVTLDQRRNGQPQNPVVPCSSLTSREREVIRLLCECGNNKAIARELGVAEITVRHHLSAIFSKVCVSSRVELVVFAFRHGLASLAR